MRILVINPGGTSTKIAVFDNQQPILRKTIDHPDSEVIAFNKVFDEFPYRKDTILSTLNEAGISVDSLNAVAGRGGLLKPIEGGTYAVNESMIKDVKQAINGEHASNLGCVLAKEIGDSVGVPSYVVDPVSVDEFDPQSRITGMVEIEKASWLHALNQKAVGRQIAQDLGRKYDDCNFIVCHLGSGISIAAHKKGKMVDGGGGRVDGPFSPERSGALPAYPLIQLCYSGQYTYKEMVRKVSNVGGMFGYLGTKDSREIEARIEKGDSKAELVYDAFITQIAKDVGSYAAVLEGDVDRIILTGGISHSKRVVEGVRKRVGFIAPVEVVAGEMEMEALALGVMRVLNKEESTKLYI